jgi:hypothetical protein
MSDAPSRLTPPPDGYTVWLTDLKDRIHSAQQRASLAVNRELVLLYWQIGRDILARQTEQGWGAKLARARVRPIPVIWREVRRVMAGITCANVYFYVYY